MLLRGWVGGPATPTGLARGQMCSLCWGLRSWGLKAKTSKSWVLALEET